jgi:hypothetical protein
MPSTKKTGWHKDNQYAGRKEPFSEDFKCLWAIFTARFSKQLAQEYAKQYIELRASFA